MKTTLLFVLLVLAFAAPVSAGPLTDAKVKQVMTQLAKSDPKGVEFVLHNLNASPAYLLFNASDAASRVGHLEDAGLLFYAAIFRYKFDLDAFPATDEAEADLSPIVDELGLRLTPQLLTDEKVYSRVVQRLEKFSVVPPAGYQPGWPYDQVMSAAGMRELETQLKAEAAEGARTTLQLLRDPEAMKQFRMELGVMETDGDNGDGAATKR